MISIVNYKMGNIRSVQNALDYIGFRSRVISTPEAVAESDVLILPGVGSFRKAMENIRGMGLYDALQERVMLKKVPILGICLGMQLLSHNSDEDGMTEGFGWIPGAVRRLSEKQLSVKVPHIGFNTVFFEARTHGLFDGLGPSADFYFVHSYAMVCERPENHAASWVTYGEPFVASVQNGNVYGTQFHPEKSQSNGLTVLNNFCRIAGEKSHG